MFDEKLMEKPLKIQDINQKNVVENSFLIWLNSMVLILTGISVHYYSIGTWGIQKNYEIVAYVIAMLFCACITLINTHFTQKSLSRYKYYMLIYMPLAVILYSFVTPEWIKFFSVFTLSFLGLCILGYDIVRPEKTDHYLRKVYFNASHLLIFSVIVSIFFIIWQSQGNSFSVKSWEVFLFTGLSFIFLQYIPMPSKYCFGFVLITLFITTYLLMDNVIDYGNASFIVGPASEFLYSNQHPLTINAQYGSGLTLFIALYYKLIGVFYLDGLIYLLKASMFIEYLLVYFIAVRLTGSYKIAVLSLIVVLIFNFYSMMTVYYSFPQIGFIRFGLIYLIILCYLLEDVLLSKQKVYFGVSVIASIAGIWSFESALYVIPAVLFAEYINGNLRRFLPVFLSCFVIIFLIYIFPLIQYGQLNALKRYYEYANLYAINSEAFFSVPLSRLTSMWWLYPILYAFILIQILAGKVKNKIVILLTVYGMAIFTYFGGRAHPNNLCIISIPFILLTAYTISQLKSLSPEKRSMLVALFFSIFGVANYAITDFGNGVNARGMKIINGIYTQNIPLLKKLNLFQDGKIKIERFQRQCDQYAILNKYLENNSLAILEYDLLGLAEASNIRLVDYYGCSHSHNAFGINPYLATTINPKAMDRVIKNLSFMRNHYILVDSRLLDKNKNLPSSAIPMVEQILTHLKASKVSQFTLGNTTFIVFKNGLASHEVQNGLLKHDTTYNKKISPKNSWTLQ